MPINFPQCAVCQHLISIEDEICEAFFKGIPSELLFGEISHETPFPGDNGILFEAIEEIKKEAVPITID